MKKIIIIFSLSLITTFSLADTHIPAGNVNGVWTFPNSPYIIDGEISIQQGDELTIEPGIQVIFSGHYKFNVYGRILAEGTANDTIVFTAQDTTVGWHSLRFWNTNANGQDSSKVVYCKLELGKATGEGNEKYGGAIYCHHSSDILIKNCLITKNTADAGGGGIFCRNSSSPSLTDVTITGNSAYWEGGGIGCDESSPSIKNSTINSNTSSSHGGGIYCHYSSTSIENVTINGNTANGSGGGIFSRESNLSLENVTVTGNNATWGGGICFDAYSNPTFNAENRCNIFLNFAGSGYDLYAENFYPINVIVDTFTVFQPDNYFAYPIDNFTFDILNAKVEPVNQDLYVSPTGFDDNSGLTPEEPLQSISWALTKIIADSTNPHTIYLTNGTYSPSQTGEIFPLNCRSYVSLQGEDENSTILDGEGLACILHCQNDNHFSIKNMTVQNGSSRYGGGIYCEDNSSPCLTNVTIYGNTAGYGGGGIYCVWYSSPSLTDVTISENSANNGGGIHCYRYSNPNLTNVTIIGNTAVNGGGIYCYSHSSPYLTNVTISGNSADDGGGIYCFSHSSPSLENVTISENTASDCGGAVACWWESSPSLLNCILWNDVPQEIYLGYQSSITVSYSDIQGGETGIVTNNNGTVYWLEGNIDEDPLFVGTELHPYSLLEDSPCIDAGNPDPIYYDPEDPSNPGYALYPAMGTIINDMGAYGGPNTIGWPVVSGDDNIVVQTPEVLLHQNYPNPFNPETTISYSLKENAKVSLKVYNIKGQKVITIVNEVLPTGEHCSIWNGRDSDGKQVGSGIYFYKLIAGDFQKVRKMILLK